MSPFYRFFKDNQGATSIEYGLIGVLVSVAIIVGVTNVGSSVDGIFGVLETEVRPELD